jgi:hypothetical protein
MGNRFMFMIPLFGLLAPTQRRDFYPFDLILAEIPNLMMVDPLSFLSPDFSYPLR